MSATARWSYTNVAVVRPFVGIDMVTGEITYGDEFEIACTWAAESTQQRDSDGAEFISRHIIYTENRIPKKLDLIQFDGSEGWEEIRSVTEWDMSFFGETPDLKLVT